MDTNFDKIIVISIDNLRADCVNGNPMNFYRKKHEVNTDIESSVLGQLVKKSVFFNNCISAAPYTSASHGAFFSGVWPLKNDVYSFFNKTIKRKLIFEWAKESGFTTIFQTDFPVILGKYLELNRGSDYYFIENEHDAFKKMQEMKKSFAFFHFAGCHYPYGFFKLKFGGNDYIKKVEQLEKMFNIQKKNSEDALSEAFRDKCDLEYLLRYKNIIETLYRQKEYDVLFDLYLEGINYFFKNRLNSFLEQAIEYVTKNNGLLLIFSDHGEEWDDYSYGHYNSTDRGVLTVPVIVYSPLNENRSKIVSERISSVDVGATLVDIIRGSSAEDLDGVSLKSQIFSDSKVASHDSFAQIWRTQETFSELLKFQNSTIQKGKLLKAKQPYLEQEIVYWDDYKLHCSYSSDGHNSTNDLREKNNKKINNTQIEKIGLGKLSKYNMNFNVAKGSNVVTNFSIRKQLEDMGYNV